MGKERHELDSDIRCPRCKRMIGDDIKGNIYVVHSTDFVMKKFSRVDFLLEVKCSKCRIYNTVFAGGVKI